MKHSVILKVLLLSIHTIFRTELTQDDSAVIHCPDTAYLGTSTQISCSTSGNFSNTVYNCPCGDKEHCSAQLCNSRNAYNVKIVNQTQTDLTIISVQPKHAGNWSCTDGGNVGITYCHLVLAKIPSVNITSDVDADSVNLGDRISLTVDIRDYHCSADYNVTLQIGSATYTSDTGRNATIKNLTQTVPINVTRAHLGNLTLVFVCGNHQWNITPEGVNELQQNRSTPTPTDDSKLLVVAAGASSTLCIVIIMTIVFCHHSWKKQVSVAMA